MRFDYSGRTVRLQAALVDAECSWILLSIGSDLPYFTGYKAPYTERLTMLAVPADGSPLLLVPELEAPRVPEGPFSLVKWADGEDPVERLKSAAALTGTVAVGDETWASHLIELGGAFEVEQWLSASSITSSLRRVKEAAEVEALRRVATRADRVARRIPEEVSFEGSSERAISEAVKRMLVEEGHDIGDFAIVGSGPNGASPHHDAGDRIVEWGEMVVLDFGGSLDGYKSDTTRTFSVGAPGARQQEVHEIVRRANAAGRASVAPGVRCEDVDRAAREVIDEAGYGEFFIHRTGHGIGLDVHEHPYMVEGNSTLLEPGMCFSVEPGIYLPGEFGVRIEDIVACGSTAVEELNNSSRELITVE